MIAPSAATVEVLPTALPEPFSRTLGTESEENGVTGMQAFVLLRPCSAGNAFSYATEI